MLVIGLLVLAAAVVVGATGVAANTGNSHQLPGGFGIFGYHIHGSVGKLFFSGLIVGAIGMIGIIMVADGLRRNAALRRELFRHRREAQSRRSAPAQAPAPTAASTAPEPPLVTAGAVTGGSKPRASASSRSQLSRRLSGLRLPKQTSKS